MSAWDFRYLPARRHTLWCASWTADRRCDCREPQPTTADLLDRIDADLGDPEETP